MLISKSEEGKPGKLMLEATGLKTKKARKLQAF